MEQIKAIIVDDEPLARKRIQKLLKNEQQIIVAETCSNGKEAIEAINKEQPDLLFLDIQMPEVDGFEVIQNIENSKIPVVIFITAYDEFALKAFDVHALDYLLKPFDQDRFNKALQKAKVYLRSESTEQLREKLDGLVKALDTPESYLSRIMIKQNGRVFFLDVEEVDWIEAAGNYVELHTGEKTYLIRETMTNMEEKLDPDQFSRIHRSTIVNINKVEELQSWFHGDYQVMLKSGTKLTMSRNYKDLLERYG